MKMNYYSFCFCCNRTLQQCNATCVWVFEKPGSQEPALEQACIRARNQRKEEQKQEEASCEIKILIYA